MYIWNILSNSEDAMSKRYKNSDIPESKNKPKSKLEEPIDAEDLQRSLEEGRLFALYHMKKFEPMFVMGPEELNLVLY